MEKITFVVPAYNVEKYLDQCVSSIENQTYPYFDVVLIDDGSTDSTPYLCDSLRIRYDNITVVHQDNQGVSSARNKGIALSDGEFVSFIDSDDFISPNMAERLISAINENGADIALCNYCKVSERGDVLREHRVVKDELADGRTAMLWLNRQHRWSYTHVGPKVYRRKLFEDVKFEENKIHEDEFIVHRLFYLCKNVVSISDILYFYRNNPYSITSNGANICHIDGMEAYYRRFLDYQKWGYRELLKGTMENSKNILSMINSFCVTGDKEKERIHDLKRMFRYMVFRVGISAGILNFFISFFPKTYYIFRGLLKRGNGYADL